MARKTFHSFALLLLVPLVWLGGSACKRTLSNDEIMGKKIVSAPGDFTGVVGALDPKYVIVDSYGVTTSSESNLLSTTQLQMRRNCVYFKNKLSHKVTWTIKFTGTYSGAEKTFTETSDTLTTRFRGTADGTRFFIAGDTINYTISFMGSPITYTGSFRLTNNVNGPHQYSDIWDQRILPNGDTLHYKLVDDMGEGLAPATAIRTSYSDANDADGAARFFVTTKQQVDGHFAFYMIGTDKNSNTYCGGSSGEALTEMYNATYEADPSKVYINAYVYGYGRPNTAISFQIFENDTWIPGDPIPTVRPPANSNDMWYSLVQVDWIGWKLVSIPYSSFKPANNPASGGNGNRIKEPHKMAGFGIELDSYPNGGSTVELALDAVYITTNGPFIP